MRLKTAVLAGCVSSALLVCGMFVLQAVMFAAAQRWSSQGTMIPANQRALFMLAVFWSRFWWLATPVVVGLVFLLVAAVYLLKGASRRLRP